MIHYTIIDWPDIQEFMEVPGFKEHSARLDSSAPWVNAMSYLIEDSWLKEYYKNHN